MPINHTNPVSVTRRHLLRAALKSFAQRGYAGTSVQHIVDTARVSKPVLYYYFRDKAAIFEGLVDEAHDERYRLMREAANLGHTVAEKLEEIVAALFAFALANRELMRLGFATAFAASGEVPGALKCHEKGRRNYDFVRALIQDGQASGELDTRFTLDELAMGIFGQLNSYVMIRLLTPECPLDRQAAKQIVRLFLGGAAARRSRGRGADASSLPRSNTPSPRSHSLRS